MTAFLLWNLNRRPRQALLASLASQYEVDVLMLIESSIPPAVLLRTLNRDGMPGYHYVPRIGCEKVEIFARFPESFIRPIFETNRLTIRHLKLPGATDILLAITHYPSKLHWSDASQALGCVELSTHIKTAEEQVGHSRTVLVGDLNMNPFEDGVVGANGLHGVMTRRIAQRRRRVVQGGEYPFFYNPMWNLFGDDTPGPPGTYYHSRSEHKVFFWNMFDQVLIRPELLPLFSNRDLRILQSDGNASLLTASGLPDTSVASDHLPLFFRLSL